MVLSFQKAPVPPTTISLLFSRGAAACQCEHSVDIRLTTCHVSVLRCTEKIFSALFTSGLSFYCQKVTIDSTSVDTLVGKESSIFQMAVFLVESAKWSIEQLTTKYLLFGCLQVLCKHALITTGVVI